MARVSDDALTLKEAAEEVGVTPDTLRRWAKTGVIPGVGRQRRLPALGRGHAPGSSTACASAATASRRSARRARTAGSRTASSRSCSRRPSRATASTKLAEETGLEEALIERIWQSIGFPRSELENLTDEDLQAVRYIAAVIDSGFPLVAFLQLVRVYGQAMSRIADAEVRLFHLYVHEPLMRDGVPGLEMAEEMENLARDLLPLASPIMDYLHQRFLQHFVEQDMVGHMEVELAEKEDLGRVRVAIAFADLAGYTRFTEEVGEEEAVSLVERFIDAVTDTLPEDARVVKTIGDEVMIVGPGRAGAHRLGGRLPAALPRAADAAHRRPLRRRALPRRRLLRARGEHVRAGGGAGARRRGDRHRLGDGGDQDLRLAPVRARSAR